MTPELRPRHNEVFSAFRFFFCVGVVAYNYAPTRFVTSNPWLCSGPEFVTFFFVLSGFIWWLSASRSAAFSASRFVARRLSWYLPLAYVGLLYYAARAVVSGTVITTGPAVELTLSRGTLVALGSHLALAQAWVPSFPTSLCSPSWFMSCLIAFVFFFPFVFYSVSRCKTAPHTSLAIAGLLWAGTQIIHLALLNSPFFRPAVVSVIVYLVYYFPLSHLCSLALGFALAHWFATADRPEPRRWTSLSFFLLTVVVMFGTLQSGWSKAIPMSLPLGASFYAPLFGSLVLAIALLSDDIVRLFDNRPMHYLGKISLPMFLLQLPVRGIWLRTLRVSGAHLTGMSDFLLYLAALVLVACLFQSLIQQKASEILMAAFHLVARALSRLGLVQTRLQ